MRHSRASHACRLSFVPDWGDLELTPQAAKPSAPYPESGPSGKGKEKETDAMFSTDVDQALSAAVGSSGNRGFIDVDHPATASSSGAGNPTPGPPPAAPPIMSATTPVVGYNGEHSSAHGTFGTPAQQFGAAGMFDPNKLDPYGDLAPPIFMNQLYQCASFVQNERLYVLQRLQELRAQGRSPPTEVLEQRYPWLYDDLRGTQLEPPSWALFRSLHCYLDDERGLLVAAQEGVPVGGGSSSVGTTQPTLDATAGQTASSGGGGGTSAGPNAAPLSSAQQSGEASQASASASRDSPVASTSQQAGTKTSTQASTITAFFKPKPK